MSNPNPFDRDDAADRPESEKDVPSQRPGGHREDADDDEKIAEVPPIDGDSIPIQGIDPAPDR